jgi:hypothetical protein
MSERLTNRVTPPRSTGICSSPGAGAWLDASYRLGEPVLADRLEHVVDGVQIERLHGVLLVGGHEDHRRGRLEPGQHLRQFQARQAGHLDVEEDRVDVELLQQAERLGRRVGREHLPDPLIPLQEEGELVEGGALVVDDEYAHAVAHQGSRFIGVPAKSRAQRVTSWSDLEERSEHSNGVLMHAPLGRTWGLAR